MWNDATRPIFVLCIHILTDSLFSMFEEKSMSIVYIFPNLQLSGMCPSPCPYVLRNNRLFMHRWVKYLHLCRSFSSLSSSTFLCSHVSFHIIYRIYLTLTTIYAKKKKELSKYVWMLGCVRIFFFTFRKILSHFCWILYRYRFTCPYPSIHFDRIFVNCQFRYVRRSIFVYSNERIRSLILLLRIFQGSTFALVCI